MTLDRMIGLDIGLSEWAQERAPVARQCGAQLVRARFALARRPQLDAPFLAAAREQVAAMRAVGLSVLAVVDSDLTVAPQGAGAFEDGEPGPLAQAWVEEMVTHAAALAAALGDQVAAWEILPQPNSDPPRIAPARWAALLGQIGSAIRSAAPGAVIVSGGLVSDEADDGVDYLRAVHLAAEELGLWSADAPPFDALGLTLSILPDGGASEEAVSAAVRDRVGRLWRLLALPTGAASPRPIAITGVGWSAVRSGEEVQARNLWTALDTLTSDEAVRCVVWSSLQDTADDTLGLCRAAGLSDRRQAWQAFSDFAQYFRQIGPAAANDWLTQIDDGARLGEPEPQVFPPEPAAVEAALVAGIVAAPHEDVGDDAPPEVPFVTVPPDLEPEVFPPLVARDPVAEPGLSEDTLAASESDAGMAETQAAASMAAATGSLVEDSATAGLLAVATTAAAEEAVETEEDVGWVTLRIPGAEELLRNQGLDGAALAAALAALAAEHGDVERLTPGQYRVPLLAPGPIPSDQTFSNQQIISALYRAGGGSWSLFEQSGLVLSELAAHRNDPYAGPPLATLGDLTLVQRQAVAEELERLTA